MSLGEAIKPAGNRTSTSLVLLLYKPTIQILTKLHPFLKSTSYTDQLKMDSFSAAPSGEQVKLYQDMSSKFHRVCSQVVLLNNKIVDYQTRYDRALERGQRSLRYVLRLQMMSVECVRNCVYEYAHRTGQQIEQMQEHLIQAGLMQEDYTDEDMDTY